MALAWHGWRQWRISEKCEKNINKAYYQRRNKSMA